MTHHQYLFSNGLASFPNYVNLEGQPVERNRKDYPYSYDAYVQWRGGKNSEFNESVYSDRLRQWDYKKYNALSQKHFKSTGQYFSQRRPKSIESFLRDYFDNPDLKLVVIQECCNASSGYPIWIFHFNNGK